MTYSVTINNEETANTNSFDAMVAFCRSFIENDTAEKIVVEFEQDGIDCNVMAGGMNIGHDFSEILRTCRLGRTPRAAV